MQPHWKDGCKGMITVNAIFAGFSGVLLVNLMQSLQTSESSPVVYVTTGLALLALLLFVFAAERITDALDESQVMEYIRSMIFHNLGVIFVLLSLALLLCVKGLSYLSVLPLLASTKWMWDLFFLLSTKRRDEYIRTISEIDR